MRRRLTAAVLAALGVLTIAAPLAKASTPAPTAYPMHAVGTVTPTDPLYAQEWGPARVRMPEAWGRSTGSSSIVIAVVDTGVDPAQPDLSGRVLAGADYVNDGASGDPNGHGTYVARVAAGAGNDGVGMAGYCWQCKILPVRVLNAKGEGSTTSVSQGVYFAANNGATIINLSLAGDRSSALLDLAIAYAESKGIIVVAAAGNQTEAVQDLTVPQYPAATAGVVAVAASNPNDALYSWSYRGSWTSVAAPGCIFTASPECGTSFASPAVAGILALGLAVAPKVTPSVLTSALYSTGAAVSGGAVPHGRVDAAAFLAALPAASVVPVRVAGANRIDTAVALSRRARSSAPSVVIARADSYADALAAAPLAGKLGAPVLLTSSAALDPSVASEIQRLGATTAWLVGGEGALSPDVEAALRAAGADVKRLAGATRYDTAALIAQQVGGGSVYVAQASGFADAVAVSSLAAFTKAPILLVDQDGVPDATANALAALHPTTVTVVGGASVISDAVVSAVHGVRLAGANRYETSKLVAAAATGAGADAGRVWVATGVDWPDALAAGPAAAADGGVLLLVDGKATSATPTVSAWLAGVTAKEFVVVGGAASVSDAAFALLQAALG